MLKKCVAFALANRNMVLIITVILIIIGILGVIHLPVDAVPDITNVQVVINTKTGALDPEKIEMLVTRPIEIEMSGLPHLDEVRSISKYGLSQVTLIFRDDTDLYFARQQVSERIQNTRGFLPSELTPELAPITTGLGEVYMYSVEPTENSPLLQLPEVQRLTRLRTIQDYVIRPVLKRISDVADVDSNGGYQKEIHVNFFPEKLEKLGITIQQLSTRLESMGESFGGGYIQKQGSQIIVRTVPGLNQLSDIEKIPLGLNVYGKPILLKEVAEVREDHALRVGAATRNGNETVIGTVLMRIGGNSRQVADDAEKAIQSLILPAGVKIVPLYSRSYLVNATIHTVGKNLIEGAVLVVVILLLLLGNFRASLIVSLAIPISMLIAVRGMITFGISGNLMSLGAIDFGLLVDGSVVLIENVLSHLKRRSNSKMTSEERSQLIFESVGEVVQPVVMGLLLIMVVYIPILTLEGIEGKMFRPMALTVLMALMASLWVAVFLMPIFAEMLIHVPHGEDHETKVFRFFKRLYQPALQYSMNRPGPLIGSALFLIILSGIVVMKMGANFVPSLDEGDMVMELARNSSIGIDASVADQKKAEETIRTYPEVESVFSRIGTPESATDPMGVNLSDTFVILKKDHSQWKQPSKESVYLAIREQLLKQNADQEISVSQPIEMRFNEILEGSRADVTLRIIGIDLVKLIEYIEKSKEVLEKISGVESVSFDSLTALKKSPMLDIAPNYDALSKYGVLLSSLNQLVELSMGGKELGSYFQEGQKFPIRIHLDESLRNHLESIERLPVDLPHGGNIPLNQLAKFSLKERVTTISRLWGERYSAISINLAPERDVSSFVEEAKSKIQSAIQLPTGLRYAWGGQFTNLSRAKARLFLIVPATLLVVFIFLTRIFRSSRETLLVFSSIPFAGVGGVFALALRGIPLSVSAGIGFIALIGIALLNALVLMTVFNSRRAEGQALDVVTMEGAMSRLRPVLMTALVASLGFIPMALNTGIGAEVQRPLATVVIGGLISSTFLTLFLLPSLYRMVMKKSE